MIGIFPYRTLMKILLIFSLFLFAPLFASTQSLTIIQETPTSFVMSIQSPEVKLSVDKPTTQVIMNITYINPTNGNEERITPESFFFYGSQSVTIKLSKPGSYLFEVQVNEVSVLTIDPMGIYTISLAIFFSVCIINIVIFTRDYVIYMES